MDDARRFELVLEELRQLLHGIADLACHVYLIGGQVLAVEDVAAGGTGLIGLQTDTGVHLDRGFSFEPDLLLDVDEMGARADVFVESLESLGFSRSREFQWSKDVGGVEVRIDLFRPDDADPANVPTGAMVLPLASEAMAKARTVHISLPGGDLDIAVPDPIGFLLLKVDAKLRHRPNQTKDSFDMYAYLRFKTPTAVRRAVERTGARGAQLIESLVALFGEPEADGVQDVLGYAGSLGEEDRALVARAVVDDFKLVTDD